MNDIIDMIEAGSEAVQSGAEMLQRYLNGDRRAKAEHLHELQDMLDNIAFFHAKADAKLSQLKQINIVAPVAEKNIVV